MLRVSQKLNTEVYRKKISTCNLRKKESESQLSSDSSDIFCEDYNKCMLELDKLYEYITAGLILHSTANWYEYGGKSSKYFWNLTKRNKAKSHVCTLVSDSGIEINYPSEILIRIKDFCSNLYKRRGTKTEKECLNACMI